MATHFIATVGGAPTGPTRIHPRQLPAAGQHLLAAPDGLPAKPAGRRRGNSGFAASTALWCRHGFSVGAPTPASSLPPQGASPRVIRDSLTIPEDRDEFDREYRRALATAAETMELAGVHVMLEQWRRRAWVTHDLEVYQRMMDRVERLRRGEALSSVPVEEVRAVIRERLSL